MTENTQHLTSLLNNDSKGIMKIYTIVFPRVKKFILQNKGKQQDAEDIFQKALLQITVRYRKEKFKINSSFEAYLFTTCKNLWRKELKIAKNRVTNNDIIELIPAERDIALTILEQKRWELFAEKLELISENCKKVLTMFFNNCSYGEIVKKMGYNSETVARQRVFKCKTKLSKFIQEDQRYNSLKKL
ncbi:RNA polymerase sigma factor [Aquimarina sp. 2201CG5-10]|uniref:RNA polymerase sigma factor n=1 Tax=Aquimarina callyspongiae TaxID=3098150 RepID=UPI002AB410F1|nr:RNA polymerase sigma factor [Aquimarina sp. 2201CG5-10]MDY8135722.1 RNA polymerase sigma factor [Aquimarina sp. 2201CG5-10]